VTKLLGKETIDTNTYGRTFGMRGSYSANYQNAGRELLFPDEVRMLDGRKALLFIRGERPIMDAKYDLMRHPAVKRTPDFDQLLAYTHGEAPLASAMFERVDGVGALEWASPLPEREYEALTELDVEIKFAEKQFKEEY
jgi:type IV secretion system protein VirD4